MPARVITKSWNDLTEQEWEKEFELSRCIIVDAVQAVIDGDEELAAIYEIERVDNRITVVRKGTKADDRGYGSLAEPVWFGFSEQRVNRWSYRAEFAGVSVNVKTTAYALRDTRPQKYGIRKDGTHNVKAISKRVEKILKDAAWQYQNEIDGALHQKAYLKRLNKAHPEFEWDEDGNAEVGVKYSWPRIEIEPSAQFEKDGFSINLKINGLTMDEIKPLIALVEQKTRDE